MPKYRVIGLDRKDGMPRDEKVEAIDEAGAMSVASDRGVMVEKVSRLREPPKTPPPAAEKSKAPEYSMLKAAGQIVRVFGLVLIAIGVLLSVLGAVAGGLSGDPLAIIAGMAPAIGAVFAGVLAAANGEALLALRDMARNSW